MLMSLIIRFVSILPLHFENNPIIVFRFLPPFLVIAPLVLMFGFVFAPTPGFVVNISRTRSRSERIN